MSRSRFALATLLACVTLSGCQLLGDDPLVSQDAGQTQPGASDPAASDPVQPSPVDPSGSAESNLGAFQAALESTLAAVDAPTVADFAASLEAAGFDRSAIEATSESDSLGAPVTYVEVAVTLGDGCLIGQYGRDAVSSVVAPVLGTGRCLIGGAAPVD